MEWLTKIFKGSSHNISYGQYHGKHGEDGVWSGSNLAGVSNPERDEDDFDYALALSLSEEEQKKGNTTSTPSYLEEDEQLARALQESLKTDESPRGSYLQPIPFPFLGRFRGICAGCKSEIGHGRYLSCMGAVWHPQCFRCHACNQPVSENEFSMHENRPYHKSCYRERYHPKCDVCKQFIPSNMFGLIEYRAHPFWLQKYCPSHEHDRTPRCCSCERMEPRDAQYVTLDDGRKLCLECLDSAIMDTGECQPLYLEIREFYEGLNMKVEQEIPLLLVERTALNEAREGEKHGVNHHLPETRGLCLSEEQTISSILRRPRFGGDNRIVNIFTEPYRVTRRCEVTAILILYGLPRLLTGSILAHEMMHAWLRLRGKLRTIDVDPKSNLLSVNLSVSADLMQDNMYQTFKSNLQVYAYSFILQFKTCGIQIVMLVAGYRTLRPDVEEGICQVLAHMWLDSEIIAGSGSNVASASSSASSSSSSSSSKKGARSQFERKLGEFFKHQIENDSSPAYGEGYRAGNEAVLKYGLRRTLDHIYLTGAFPY